MVGRGNGHSVYAVTEFVEHNAVIAETGNGRIFLIGLRRALVVDVAKGDKFDLRHLFQTVDNRIAAASATYKSHF